MLENFIIREKKIILFISTTTLIVLTFLYLIINLNSFSKTKSEFITRSIKQMTKEISIPLHTQDFTLTKNILSESLFLDYLNYVELKGSDNSTIFLKNSKNKLPDNYFEEPIYHNNKLLGKLFYNLPNSLLNPIGNNLINTIILSLLILILLILVNYLIKSKKNFAKLENEKEQIQPLLTHLSKLFSHDFRKPFNLLKMLLSNIRKSKNNYSEIETMNAMIIGEIEKNMKRVDSIIHDIIELGSESKPNNEILDIKTIFEETINSTQLQNEINKFKLDLKLDKSGKINVDPSKFNKALITIISYTIKNTPIHENIWIKTGNIQIKNKPFTYIKIGSKFCYIPLKEIECVFNLFYNNKIKGNSGFELATCRKIIESHNGFIKCNSNKSIGTEFVINLPNYNC